MFGVISLGQAGGSIGDLFAEKGYKVAAINYSQRDLDSLNNTTLKLKLVGSEGVGKLRENAVNQMTNNWESCLSFINEHFSQPSTELIFVIFSTSGGSGSGIAPLLSDLLLNELENKTIVCCPILPSENESIVAHLNTLECLKEISELDVCILPIDNNKFNHLSKNELYKIINRKFVELIINLINQTDQFSLNGNLDRQDLLVTLQQRGFANISYSNLTNINQNISLSEESVTKSIINSWYKGVFTNPSYSKIVRFGLIFNGQENLIPMLNIQNILSEFKNKPLDVMEGYYHERKGEVYTILTGLEFNTERLKQIEYKTITDSESLSNVLSRTHGISYKSSNLQIKPKQKDKKALSSILSKYQK